MNALSQAKSAAEAACAEFEQTLTSAFPGAERWHWFRACAHMRHENVRRNDDTTNDAAMAAHQGIKDKWDAYIVALHAFYKLRDGPGGVLGGRGL